MSEIKLQVGKLIKDWYHSKTGVSLMHDPSLISLVNEIEALGLSHVSNSTEYTRGYKDGWIDCCKDVKEFG